MVGADVRPLELATIIPPSAEWRPRLLELYRLWDSDHARGPWARDLERRLTGPLPEGALDRFYWARHGEQAAAALDVTRSKGFPGLGLVHRVFTHPVMRRRGIGRDLVEFAKADFRASGGRLLLVVSPEGGTARAFYERAGFREVVRARDGESLMGWAARGRHVREALLRFLRHEPVRWRDAQPGDWAALVAWSSMPGGRPDAAPATVLDGEWIDALGHAGADDEEGERPGAGFRLRVGESRHGYVVAVRAEGEPPQCLRPVIG
jgi:ribosomal protein S18 acetylase RimI-like enzyme